MPKNAQELIRKGLKGLPPEAVSEIAAYVFFLRKKYLEPEEFEDELAALIRTTVKKARSETLSHLEKEFEGYAKKFPRK